MKLDKYAPMWRHVLVKDVTSRKTETGIFLPEDAKIVQMYEVVKKGPQNEAVEIGDRVLLDPNARNYAIEIEFDEGVHLQVLEQNIIGVIKK